MPEETRFPELPTVCQDVASTLLGLSELPENAAIAGQLEELSERLSRASKRRGEMIRIELQDQLAGQPNQSAKAYRLAGDKGQIPGEIVTVIDVFGKFKGGGKEPQKRGAVGYAVWMRDLEQYEVLSLHE
jgi:hypothetical protein